MRRAVLAALAAAALLAGCANPHRAWNLEPGTPRQDVLARAGQPVRVLPLPGGGERLQYTMQPVGHYAWMVDLDASGRVVSARQVLNATEFARIVPGQWTRRDLEREFGPPAMVGGVGNWRGEVLTWRWMDLDRSPMFLWAFVDPAGVVQRWQQSMEYVNAPNDRE